MQAQKDFFNFDPLLAGEIVNDPFVQSVINVCNLTTDVAPKVRVGFPGRLIVCAVCARQRNLGDEIHFTQTSQRSVDRGEADRRLPTPHQCMNVGHGQVGSDALFGDHVVDESVILSKASGQGRHSVILPHRRIDRSLLECQLHKTENQFHDCRPLPTNERSGLRMAIDCKRFAICRQYRYARLAAMDPFRLIDARSGSGSTSIATTLQRFGAPALRFAHSRDIKVVALARRQRYAEASSALARLRIDVDAWPAPPAGLFVVEERTVYLRSRSPMTVAHEFGHALDCALGGGVYRSSIDPEVRGLFSNAREFVTPYAATAIDEYFAENLRAYVEANDPASFWPLATRERLRRVDPLMLSYVERLFEHDLREEHVA